MTHEERAHIERLLDIHRASLRELEVQAATFGDLHVPVHVKLQIAEHQGKIAELEARMAELLPLHNLPPRDYERFVGRQKELADVRRLLLPYPKSRYHLITVDGIGGIGKSALALEAAYSYCDGYAALAEAERFGAIVWVSAKRSYLTADGILERRQAFRTLDDLYAAIAQVLDFPAITRARAEEQRAIVEQVLGEQRTLLILDNLETVDDEDLLVFLRELPDPTKAIVTTRHRIDVAHPIRLTGMPQEDALTLIDQEAARKAVMLSADDREQLWLRTGGVPLAIVWSIGLMGLGGSVESVLRRLGSGQSDIAKFCFAESVAHIRDRDAYWLLLALSLFVADASREALGVVAGLGEDSFGRDMGFEELLRLSLVNKDGDRFSLLPLTKSFVQGEASRQPEFSGQARTRLYNYVDVLTHERGGWSKDWEGQELIERELPNLLAVIDSLFSELHYREAPYQHQLEPASIPLAQLLCKILPRVARTCRIRGHWSISEMLCARAISISQYDNDPYYVGHRYWDLCRISMLRHDTEETERRVQRAILELQRVGNGSTLARAQSLLGLLLLQRGDQDNAERLIVEGLAAYRATGKRNSVADLIENHGHLAYHRGDYAAAEKSYQEAINEAQTIGDLPRMAVYQLNLGQTLVAFGKTADAILMIQQSQQTAIQCGRLDTQAAAALWLAKLDQSPEQCAVAAKNARQALNLFRRLGMRKEQVEVEDLLRQLGESA